MFFFFMVVILNDRFEEAYSMMGDVGREGREGERVVSVGRFSAWQLELFLGELRNVIVIKKTRQHHNCIDF